MCLNWSQTGLSASWVDFDSILWSLNLFFTEELKKIYKCSLISFSSVLCIYRSMNVNKTEREEKSNNLPFFSGNASQFGKLPDGCVSVFSGRSRGAQVTLRPLCWGWGKQVTQHTTDTYITMTSGDRIKLWMNLPSSGIYWNTAFEFFSQVWLENQLQKHLSLKLDFPSLSELLSSFLLLLSSWTFNILGLEGSSEVSSAAAYR